MWIMCRMCVLGLGLGPGHPNKKLVGIITHTQELGLGPRAFASAVRTQNDLHCDGSASLAFLTQTHIFGQTAAEQNRNYVRECRAYYSFIYPDHILSRSNITELFQGKSCMSSGEFIESVTII